MFFTVGAPVGEATPGNGPGPLPQCLGRDLVWHRCVEGVQLGQHVAEPLSSQPAMATPGPEPICDRRHRIKTASKQLHRDAPRHQGRIRRGSGLTRFLCRAACNPLRMTRTLTVYCRTSKDADPNRVLAALRAPRLWTPGPPSLPLPGLLATFASSPSESPLSTLLTARVCRRLPTHGSAFTQASGEHGFPGTVAVHSYAWLNALPEEPSLGSAGRR
jgi:hypothetical protein